MTEPVIITVGGGKGGVGKSVVTSNIGALLACETVKVGFVDADLSGANLHHCLGVKRPRTGLQDFLAGRARLLSDTAIETVVPHTWLISGTSDNVSVSNPTFGQKQKLIQGIRRCSAGYILVDLGAGADADVGDFFAAFEIGIVVSDALPTSIENAYGYLKNGLIRGLCHLFPGDREMQAQIKTRSDPAAAAGSATMGELLNSLEPAFPVQTVRMRQWLHRRRSLLVLNMVRTPDDVAVGRRFVDIVKRYLAIDMFYIGYVVHAMEVRSSVKHMRPVVLDGSAPAVRECFDAIVSNIQSLTRK